MRIGSVILFLVFSWVGLGFILSDNINMRHDLTQTQQQLDYVTEQNNALQRQLDSAHSENSELKLQISRLTKEVVLLQEQVTQIQNEYDKLKEQYANLQNQYKRDQRLNTVADGLNKLASQPYFFALFVPVIPTSLIAGYVIYQRKRHHGVKTHGQIKKYERTFVIYVTEDEMRQIAKSRRGIPVDC